MSETKNHTNEYETRGVVHETCDVLVVGAGPGGLAAAKSARDAGAEHVFLIERDDRAGGILNQCIHDGFGIVRYRKQLTGPEYALRAEQEAEASGIELLTGCHVLRIDAHTRAYTPAHAHTHTPARMYACTRAYVVTAVSADGLKQIEAGAVVIATGCRERTRGAIAIPGSRPAGVFTAGVTQNFVNIRNIMPGKKVVVFGSGDVGMIMARRLSLEGAKVEAVIEILPEPAGLSRNVSQCLYDYGIPIFCSHTVSRIIGKKRLEAVEISEVDESMQPIKGTERLIACDTLVLSVGLIPENEVAQTAGIKLDAKTNGMMTDQYLQTNVPGIFACGNARRIMDLADFVSEQGELAGRNAVAYLNGTEMDEWDETRTSSMAKGFPEEGVVTCTLCPTGCQVRYNEALGEYEGNKCKRGAAFAEQERVNPQRILTTTVKVANRKTGDGDYCRVNLLPVRSTEPVSKRNLPQLVHELSRITVEPPVKCGDVVAEIQDGEKTVAIAATADCSL
ncbi:MAG: FAD-dependent oxidoreductase [Firmicutes bacterium]|nr:FAD-dependent oxidoreductase [Bacillota bacterium]